MTDSRGLSLIVAGLTDVGKKRQRNEDSLRWVTPTPGSPEAALGTVILVCDGMGGVGQGDVASQTAVERFFAVYYDLNYIEPNTEKRVHRALEVAHDAVREAAARLSRLYIGTTAAGVVIKADGSVLSFNLGDSRVYRLRGDTLEQLSKDQSVNAAMLERGDITPQQALEARNNNITMFIGHPLEMVPIYVHTRLEPGDVYIACSDGLWDVVREKQMREILIAQPPQQAVRTLVDQTLRNGAPDNVSVIIASTRTETPRRRWWPLFLALLLVVAAGVAFVLSQSQPPPGTVVANLTDDASTETPPPTQAATDQLGAVPSAGPPSVDVTGQANVQILPSDTPPPSPTATDTLPPSETPTEPPTETPTLTETPTGTATETATRRPTRTPLPSDTPTASLTPSPTTTQRATRTPSATRTNTPTTTNTFTPTNTATNTATPTATDTPSPMPTSTPTYTPQPSNTPTGTLPPTATHTATATSTSNPEFWSLLGTPTNALKLVALKPFGSLAAPPIEIYEGNIERVFASVTEPDPLDPGAKYTLVYIRANILAGDRFWWLIEDVQPQFEVLAEAGIRVYATASFLAPQRPSIAQGELVIVTGISPNQEWFRIRSRRGEGWVNAQVVRDELVRFLGDINDVPTVFPPSLDQSTATSTPSESDEQPPTAQPGGDQPPQPPAIPEQPTNPPAPTDVPPAPTAEPPTPEPPTEEPPTAEPPTPEPPTEEPPPEDSPSE